MAHLLFWACVILLNIPILFILKPTYWLFISCSCLPSLGLQKLPSAYHSLKLLMCGELAMSWLSLYLADNLFCVDCDYQLVGPLPQANLCRGSSDAILYFLHGGWWYCIHVLLCLSWSNHCNWPLKRFSCIVCSFRRQTNIQLPTTWNQKSGTASVTCPTLWMTWLMKVHTAVKVTIQQLPVYYLSL